MRQFRLVALLPLLGAVACTSDAPAQSTFPEQQYVSGPPGGAMDPEPAAAPYGGEQASSDPAGDAVNDADSAPIEIAPQDVAAAPSAGPVDLVGPAPSVDSEEDEPPSGLVAPASPGVEGGLVAPADPGIAQADLANAPTAGVTDVEIDATLQGYGQWIENDDYGQVWRPDATVVGVDFTPYESGGSWAYTDAGWGFNCDYSWGWLPFHYGRWAWFHDYWGWVPGHRWAPAWVDWRHGGGVIGWRPTAPGRRDHRDGHEYHHGGGNLVRDHRHAETHDAHWRFAATRDFARPHIRSHLYGSPAEGLRVTSRVNAPPLRARTTLHAGDLMRNRYQPAQGIRANPRYQAYGPQRPYAPTETWRRPAPGARPQPYQPGRVMQPGAPSQPPSRTWQPSPTRGYPQPAQPPSRVYQPPPRAYQPPSRGYQPPARTFQPSSRPFTPSAPSSAPSRSWAPPAAPPSRSYSPPAAPPSHSSPPPAAPPSHSSGSHDGGGRSGRR